MTQAGVAGERTVLVDMDGVQADFEGPTDDIIRAHFPDVPLITPRPEFYYEKTYREHAEVAVREPGFFRGLPRVEGAIMGWHRIMEAGYTPRICSSPVENHETVVAEKEDWLEEHFVPVFGGWVVETASSTGTSPAMTPWP